MASDDEIIRWAKRLESVFRNAPAGIWFYVANGTANVVRLDSDGDRAKLGNGTSFDPDAVVYSLTKVPIALDGGDW